MVHLVVSDELRIKPYSMGFRLHLDGKLASPAGIANYAAGVNKRGQYRGNLKGDEQK
jgi:hypothetical protein